MAENWVNIGSGNGLLPDGSKPLPEAMLTNDQLGLVAFFWGQFHSRYLSHNELIFLQQLQQYQLNSAAPVRLFTCQMHIWLTGILPNHE